MFHVRTFHRAVLENPEESVMRLVICLDQNHPNNIARPRGRFQLKSLNASDAFVDVCFLAPGARRSTDAWTYTGGYWECRQVGKWGDSQPDLW